MRGWRVWGAAFFVAGCGGRVGVLDETPAGGASGVPIAQASAGNAAVLPEPNQSAAGAGGRPPAAGGAGAAGRASGTSGAPGIVTGGGGNSSDDGGAGGAESQPPGGASSVGVAGPDQSPTPDSCGGCDDVAVCHPGVGCESVCDVQPGLQAGAAWPIGGGCATRRGLSRFSGPKSARIAFSIGLGNEPAPYSSAITLGADHEIYVPASSPDDDTHGFARIAADGSKTWFADWLGEVPVLAENGVLYTVPMNLQATDHDGHALWSLSFQEGDHLRIDDQEGEPVVGANGTIYAPGIIHDAATAQDGTGLIAVSPQGELLWGVSTGINVGLTTWPAIASDGTIYFGDANGSLWAVSPAGEKLWSAPIGDFGWGYPAVDHAQNVFIGNGENFASFRPDGSMRFEVSMPINRADGEMFVFSHPAIAPDGTVFMPFTDQDPVKSLLTSGVVAFSNDGRELWKRTYEGYEVSTPVVDRDGILFFTTESTLHAFDTTGNELWSQVMPAEDGCQGTAIASDGTLLVECNGTLVGVRAAN